MLKYTDFLTESKGDKTVSYWETMKSFLSEQVEKGVRIVEEKLSEYGYEYSDHFALLNIGAAEHNYGFGYGVKFSVGDNKYLLIDNFSENRYFLYVDHGGKHYSLNNKAPKLLRQEFYIEDIMIEVKKLNTGIDILEIYYQDSDDESERFVKVDVSHIQSNNLLEYVNMLAKICHKGLLTNTENFHLYFYFKDKAYHLMGEGQYDRDVLDSKQMLMSDEKMRKITQ